MQALSTHLCHAIFECSQDGIWVTDKNHKIIYANPAMARIAGGDAAQIIDAYPLQCFPEGADSAFGDAYTRAMDTGVPQSYETRLISATMRDTWLGGWLTPIFSSGEFSSMACSAQDITARKKTEELQAFLARTGGGTKDEPFFHALARYLATSLGMFYVCIDRLEGDGLNAQTLAVWCDGHFEDNVTYALKDTPCGDVVGREICCFPASVCSVFPRDQVLQDLGAESYIGTTLWSHTGHPIGLIAVIGRAPLDPQHIAESVLKTVAVRAAAELERLDAETSLREREERLQAAQDYANIGSWELYPDGKTAIWSKQIYKIFGLPTDVTAGPEQLERIVHPGDLHVVVGSLLHSLATGIEHYAEYRIRRLSDGVERWIECRGKAVLGVDGSVEKLSGFVQDITEHKQLQEELQQQATTDELTGAINRRHFLELARNELKRTLRLQHPMSLASIDIDNFKRINDTYGHLSGDRALCALAQACKACIREIDVFARLGGDEFIILLPETSAVRAHETIERVRQEIEHLQIEALSGETYSMTISAGIANLSSYDESFDALLIKADRALYQAKAAGRNCIIVSS